MTSAPASVEWTVGQKTGKMTVNSGENRNHVTQIALERTWIAQQAPSPLRCFP